MYSHGQKMVNMFKKVCENESALLILLIFYIKKSQKSNRSLDNKKKWGEILWKTLDTIIGTPRNSYE